MLLTNSASKLKMHKDMQASKGEILNLMADAVRHQAYIYIGRAHIYSTCYIYICIYIHTYVHIYIHTYVHTYIYIHTQAYTYVHAYLYTQIYIYTYIHIHIHIYAYIYVHEYVAVAGVLLAWRVQCACTTSLSRSTPILSPAWRHIKCCVRWRVGQGRGFLWGSGVTRARMSLQVGWEICEMKTHTCITSGVVWL